MTINTNNRSLKSELGNNHLKKKNCSFFFFWGGGGGGGGGVLDVCCLSQSIGWSADRRIGGLADCWVVVVGGSSGGGGTQISNQVLIVQVFRWKGTRVMVARVRKKIKDKKNFFSPFFFKQFSPRNTS